MVAQVADTFLECGVLEHGFARIRCDACTHEYLLAFSCRCRYCCPSCHAKRLAIWTQWLETTLFAPVPHRQVVLTIPKRLRAYGLYRRRLLGEIARVAARTLVRLVLRLGPDLSLADVRERLLSILQGDGAITDFLKMPVGDAITRLHQARTPAELIAAAETLT
ncbi:transposase zinc-binding domain-containing protein [Gemmatimonas sp.]|uniref:transposase zinc-binding domain-containing protein n=1 Tax=Gemmatimonas sp. TaxID=1962908 RepID=UPI0022CB1713|nr:transposase zinc-binding domain-containing protein [Gemmatimonas sp.]MCZ8205046.1 transposase zinc-binding domain-containing protein [Gemmatimonas sp.]